MHSDSASLEIKDGLLFEPQLKKYLWSEQQLQDALMQKQDLIVVSQPHNFATKDPSVKLCITETMMCLFSIPRNKPE